MPNPKSNEDVQWLYGKLKSEGYDIGTEQEFSASLANEDDRKWYYDKATGMGLDMGSMDDFNSLYAPQPASQSAAKPQPAAPASNVITQEQLDATDDGAGAVSVQEQKAAPVKPSMQNTQRMRELGQMVQQSKADVAQSSRYIGALGKRKPLDVPGRVELGRSGKVVEGEKTFNTETGKIDQKFYDSKGNEYDNRAVADHTQRNIDAIERYEADPVGEELKDAETELQRLEGAFERAYNKAKARYEGDGGLMDRWAGAIARSTGGMRDAVLEDPDVATISAAIDAQEERIKNLKLARDKKDAGLWRGVKDNVEDIKTYDILGLTSIDKATRALKIKNKLDRGEALTEAEESLMHGLVDEGRAQGMVGDDVSILYNIGSIGVQAVPFMVGTALSGGFSTLGRGVTKGVIDFGRKNVVGAISKAVGRKAANQMVRATGWALGDLAASAVQAGTIRSGHVAADVINRHLGQFVEDENGDVRIGHYEKDENGNAYFVDGGDDWGKALYKGVASEVIEQYTEKLGEHLHLGQWFQKAIGKTGLRGISSAMENITDNATYKTFNKLMKRAGLHDVGGEIIEEEINIPLNAIFTGDNEWRDLLDKRTQLEIVGGMLFSVGSMHLAGITVGQMARGVNFAKYKKLESELADADRVASFRLTKDRWTPLKEKMDGASNEDLAGVVAEIADDESLLPEEALAVADYFKKLTILRGYNAASLKRTETATPEEQAELVEAAQTQLEREQEVEQAQNEGREAFDTAVTVGDTANVDAVKAQYEVARDGIYRAFEDDAEMRLAQLEDDPWEVLEDNTLNDEQRNAAAQFINSRAAVEGLSKAAEEHVEGKRAEAEERIKQRTHRSTGMIQPAVLKVGDRQVYIVSGHVEMFPDGSSVNETSSDGVLWYVDAASGELNHTSPDRVFSIGDAVAPEHALATEFKNIEDEANAILGDNVPVISGENAPARFAPNTEAIDNATIEELQASGVVHFTDSYLQSNHDEAQQRAREDLRVLADATAKYKDGEINAHDFLVACGYATGEKSWLDDGATEQEITERAEQQAAAVMPYITENTPKTVGNSREGNGDLPEGLQLGNGSEASPQRAIDRIPKDEKGMPLLEEIDPDTAWDGVVEYMENEDDAKAYVDGMVKSLTSAVKTAETNVKKVSPNTDMADFKAKRAAVREAETRLAKWQAIADVKAKREEAAKAQREQQTVEPVSDAGPVEAGSEGNGAIGTTSSAEEISAARKATNGNPTEGQKAAGNYAKGHIKVDGYDIALENPKGSTRSGKDADGKEWSIEMKHDYGYIKGTEGVDGDHIDVYLSDEPSSGNVYVVDQINQKDGSFDEHKVMYGFNTMDEAVQAYRDQYEEGWKVGAVTEVSREDFKKWVESSHRKTKPFSEYKGVKKSDAPVSPMDELLNNDGSNPMRYDVDTINEKGAKAARQEEQQAQSALEEVEKKEKPKKKSTAKGAVPKAEEPKQLNLFGDEQNQETQPAAKQIMGRYNELKEKHPNAVLVFRNSDSYGMYADDAKVASKVLDIPVEKRDGLEVVSFSDLDANLPKLVRARLRVAICEPAKTPTETPKQPAAKKAARKEEQQAQKAQVRKHSYNDEVVLNEEGREFTLQERLQKKEFLLNGNPVSTLVGNEFSRVEGKSLTDQVVDFFDSFGGKATSPLFGDVTLDRNGADDSLAHGVGRLKVVAYGAVKDVIEQGTLIGYHRNHKNRGYDSAVVAAPIKIGDKDYVCSVVIRKNRDGAKFYLHEVIEKEKLLDEGSNTAQKQPQRPRAFAKVLLNIVSAKKNAGNLQVYDENGNKFRLIGDDETELLDFLNSQPTRKGFRYSQWANYGVLPPMTAKVNGEWRAPQIFSRWEQSEALPQNADGTVDLKRDGKTTAGVAYNPYFHVRTSPLNDQFTSAYDRPELIVVEGEYPESELTSGYRAPGAHDPVGLMAWHSGSVNAQLSEDTKVNTMLTRYFKPGRIVPWSEVADRIMENIGDQHVVVPINQVPPMLRYELAKRGVKFGPVMGSVAEADVEMLEDLYKRVNAGEWDAGLEKARAYLDAYESSDEAKEARVAQLSEKLNTPIRVVHADEVMNLPSRRMQRAKGWWSAKDDAVVVVMPNNVNVADVENTAFHEVVGHKGLRALIGEERFNEFLDEVHEHASNPIRKEIDKLEQKLVNAEAARLEQKYASDGLLGKAKARAEAEHKREQFRREATEEFMADMAGRIGEKGFEKMEAEELTFWGKIKERVMKFLDKFLNDLKIAKSVKLTDKDIAYILYKSYKNLKNGGKPSLIEVAEDVVMREKLHFNEEEAFGDNDDDPNGGNKKTAFTGSPNQSTYAKTSSGGVPSSSRSSSLGILTALKKASAKLGNKAQSAKNSLVKYFNGDKRIELNGDINHDIKEMAKNLALGYTQQNYYAEYGIGDKTVTFRIGNHKAVGENFARNNSDENISVYIEKNAVERKDSTIPYDEYKISSEDYLRDREGASRMLMEGVAKLLSGEEFTLPKPYKLVVKDGVQLKEDDAKMRFRDGGVSADDVSDVSRGLRQEYDSIISSSGYQVREALQDSMLGLKTLMEVLQKHSDKKEIADWENAYMAENALSSRNKAEQDEYKRKFYNPLMDAMRDMDMSEEELGDYVMAKHGIERNREMAVRSALTEDGKLDRAALSLWNQRKDDVRGDASLSTWEMKQRALDEIALNEFGADLLGRDYSGLTSLFSNDSVEDALEDAYELVNTVEDNRSETAVNRLGDALRAATGATLDKLRQSGMINGETRREIGRMYDYYVPLRGFDETTADEVYAYVNNERSGFSSPLKSARGRSSKADNPFAYITSMADSAILQGNKNLVKLMFLNFVQKRPSDLVSVNDMWIKRDPATDEWVSAFPDIPDDATPEEVADIVRQFNEGMQSEVDNGNPDIKRIKGKTADVPYRTLHDQLGNHQVVVKRDGKEYVLTVNANPRAAMALNGRTNPHADYEGVGGAFKRRVDEMNRLLAGWYTTKNPDFVASNYVRDAMYSNSMVWVKESPRYAVRYHKNFVKFNPKRMINLLHKHNHGKLDMNNPVEREFYRFIMNGGETGYSNLKEIEELKKELTKDLTNSKLHQMKALLDRFEIVNRAVENGARFAAYMSSREEGRSIQRSVFDAKEISVNFNKKGAGGTFFGSVGQTKMGNMAAAGSAAGRSLYVFFNAGVQGTTNLLHAAKHNKAKFGTLAACYFMLGYLAPLLWGGGDDDDDDHAKYEDLPDHVRRTNLIIPAGKNYISLPLPVEYRTLYGMGELASNVLSGRERYTTPQLIRAMSEQVTQALPINFLDGEGTGVLSPFVPSAVAPLYQAHENMDWTGMPIYKSSEYNKSMPEWTKAFGRTNRHLVDAAKWLNDVSGGDEFTKGAIDLNPALVEHIMQGYFGGAVTFVNKVSNSIDMAKGDMEFDWRNVPIGNRLIKSGSEYTEQRAINREYYSNRDKWDVIHQRERGYINKLESPGLSSEERKEWREKLKGLYNSEEWKDLQAFHELGEEVSELSKQLKEMPDGNEELSRMIWELKQQANEILREDNN